MLTLSKAAESALRAAARDGYPHEACGVLVGRRDDDGATVGRAVRCGNLNAERARDRYDLDPGDFLRADREARAAGEEIVGIWHSHPDHPARPSETDRAAAWEGWSYLILSVTADGVRDLRSWRLDGEAFAEEPVRTPEAANR